MSKPRWHPLPVDSQVVAAIEDRKDKFMQAYAETGLDQTQDQWIFNHICTVLDHTKRIFEMSEQELCNPESIKQQLDEELG